ncbi:hypothetical protein [Aquamicrobium terrae]|uniref:Pectinesterase inhibitor domain-containing protein n=1 Tax=Aquamicrobium terrae TaxID=1324945 RepID=A0ABV2MUN8_9HYPH
MGFINSFRCSLPRIENKLCPIAYSSTNDMLQANVFTCSLVGYVLLSGATGAQELLVVLRPTADKVTQAASLDCLDAYDQVDEASAVLSLSADILRLCAAMGPDGNSCDRELRRVVFDHSKFRDAMLAATEKCTKR